jgi:hypothetical protein
VNSFSDQTAEPRLLPASWRIPGAGLVLIALAGAAAGAFLNPQSFWPAYLTAASFWLGMSLGCLGVLLLHRITGGRWGIAAHWELCAGAAALPVGIVAAAIVMAGTGWIYPWANESEFHHLALSQQQFFETPFQAGRVIVEAAILALLALWVLWTAADFYRDPNGYRGARKASLGLLLFFMTASFLVVDGVMSTSAGWSSSVFPLMEVVGFGVSALSVALIARGFVLTARAPTEEELQRSHDLGTMLQAFNLVWVYLAFSQYLIIWSGDLPHEVEWYLDRRGPVSGLASLALFAFHFVVPFGLLLSRPLKRDPAKLAGVAALLLVMRTVDLGWIILPSRDVEPLASGLILPACWLAIGGFWFLMFERAHVRYERRLRLDATGSPAPTAEAHH